MSRVVVALGGNAIAPGTDPFESAENFQREHIAQTSRILAEVVAAGHQMVITHGNGPQVGNLFAKNEIAASVVPPVSLAWCVAQTQATIAFEMMTALEADLRDLDAACPVLPVITRVRVDPDDPAFSAPTKPIGRYVESDGPPDLALPEHHRWVEARPGLWRRAVPSPKPIEIVESDHIGLIIDAGGVVIAGGGGGVPVIMGDDRYSAIDAVIDKDSTAVLLAQLVGADRLVILTDIEGAAVGFGTPEQRFLGTVEPEEMREHLANGEFGVGSMESKVAAAVDFAESTGAIASIGSLGDARSVIDGTAGTHVQGGAG